MSLIITSQMIEKLAHNLLEIRVRALKDIDGKISRAILDDQDIDFNPVQLIKSLIRWFGQQPLCEEKEVLNLITNILNTKHGKEVIHLMGKLRIEKEINKIKLLLSSSFYSDIHELQYALDNLQSEIDQEMVLKSAQITSRSNLVSTIDLTSLEDALLDEDPNHQDFVKCWSLPSPIELNALRSLNDSLKSDDINELNHALKFMITAMRDYSAEYFLQSPFLYKSITQLLTAEETNNNCNILEILTILIKSLQKRIKLRQLTETYCWSDEINNHQMHQNINKQISLECFSYNILIDTINYIKDITSDKMDQINIRKSFKLIMEIIALLEETNEFKNFNKFHEILNEFGYFAKYFRQLYENKLSDYTSRINYLIIIQIIAKLSQIFYKNEKKKQSKIILETENLAIKNVINKNWYQELEIILIDFPIKEIYPEVYKLVSSSVCLEELPENSTIKILLNSDEKLLNAIEILRNPNNFNDYELIEKGLGAIETIHLHKSIELVKLLFNIICRSIINFDTNEKLKENSEKLFLLLLSNNIIEIKTLMYYLSAEKMKDFFSSLMDGETMMSKYWAKQSGQSLTLGIPITIDILKEIICFGYESVDTTIHCNSETMLMFIVRGKTVLGSYWNNIMEIVYPVMPLLQCITDHTTSLGKAILELFDPDNDIELTNMIKGNIRFLFNNNPIIRDEAIKRLIYIINSHPQTKYYQPNIQNITDTISNSLCFLENKIDINRIIETTKNRDDEIDSIIPLIELLKSDNVEPAIRKTTLIQLNYLASNRKLAELIHDNNGWFHVLTALDNSLKQENTVDYQDAGIPSVGIFTKLLIQLTHFRLGMTFEPNILFLLLRSLIIFQHSISHKINCTISLFLLLFNDFIIGSGKLSLPFLCNKIHVPFLSEYHWKLSPNIKENQLEDIIDDMKRTTDKNENIKISNEQLWKYLRLNYAKLWFNGFENILENAKICRSTNTDCDATPRINYSLIEIKNSTDNDDNNYETIKTLDFNAKLKIIKKDLALIKSTDIKEIFRYYLKQIENATTHTDVYYSIQRIQCNLLLPLNNNVNIYQNSLIRLLKRFYLTPPNNHDDEQLFINVIDLLGRLIELDFDGILIPILQELHEKNCVFFVILFSDEFSMEIFTKNNIFLTQIIRKSSQSKNKDVIKLMIGGKMGAGGKDGEKRNLFYKFFFSISEILLDKKIMKYDFDNLRSLIVLLRVLTTIERLEIDNDYLNSIINSLLSLISLTKSFNQSGSDFNKNCLLAIGNIIENITMLKVKEKYIKLLSGLCGHHDFLIRSLSWNLLNRYSKNFENTKEMIKILSYLPGGIHACCLSTVLDTNEIGLVKETAACLFGTLLNHGTSSKGLPISVAPLCSERKSQPDDEGYNLLMVTIRQQKFFERVQESLKYFTTSDIIDFEQTERLTTCNVVRGYSVILLSLVDLNPNLLSDQDLISCIYGIVGVLVSVPMVPTESSIKMVSEISKLLVRSFKYNQEFLNRIVMHDHAIMASLGYLLNLKHYDHYSNALRDECLINIMQVIRIIIETTNGFQFVSSLWSEKNSSSLLNLLNFTLKLKQTEELRISSMLFLCSIYSTDITNLNYETIIEHFEMTVIEPVKEDVIKEEKNKIKYEKTLEKLRQMSNDSENCCPNTKNHHLTKIKRSEEKNNNYKIGVEILTVRLIELYNFQCTKDKPNNGLILSSYEKCICFNTIGLILKNSIKAKDVANNENFLDKVIDRLEKINIGFGMSCTDFIRKHGDNKKEPIIEDLSLLTNLLMNWYQTDCLQDQNNVTNLCQIFLKLWPWTNTNTELQLKFMNLFVVLSENSITICKGITVSYTGSPHSLIQLIGNCVNIETTKIKCSQTNLNLLKSGLRVLSNCCSCIEGRLQIIKMNLLDNISKLHPSVTKQQKPWNIVSIYWLKFWNVYTRYLEGNSVRHLSVLCAIIKRSTSNILKMESLNILKNMAFANENRAALLASDDFLYTIKEILNGDNQEEQFLVLLIIWKLVTNNYKGKHVIKNSSIPGKIENLLKFISIEQNCNKPDLYHVVVILNNILRE